MHDETEVWFVVTHPEGGGRDERLHLVVQQRVFELMPAVGIELAGVGGDVHRIPVYRPDGLDEPVGVGDGEDVDDARTREVGQGLRHPAVSLHGRESVEDVEVQRLSGERSAEDECGRVGTGVELRGNVLGDARVGGRGGRQNRRRRVDRAQYIGDTTVVGPEVVAPVGDGMRLVDHQQPEIAGQRVEHAAAEAGIRQAFR
ncbi:UNVERIFIED_ORG: hypothetical protein L601_000500000250 [Gordonia westfalica J30]